MDEAFQRVLELVSAGRLTAEEAGPILDALGAQGSTGRGPAAPKPGASAGSGGQADGRPADTPTFARIEVRESGRRVVDLRVPISLGRFALHRVPGLSSQHIADVEEAVASGNRGPILDIEDADGSGVRIVLE
ncbi:MAG TPA: hypothetical protein VI687_03645 [Candidatus Limnocylindrales bacterium]|jgi:hypothetical protein|nr:hypothetical protein [Candidatus Limnocylindrales bacterium]